MLKGQIWRIRKGLPTNSPESVALANLYLVEPGETVQLVPVRCGYKRYIDDLLLRLSSDCVSLCIERLHVFHQNI